MTGAFERADRLHHRPLRRVRDVDHDSPPVHFLDDLTAERREAAPRPLVVRLAGVRVGELTVAVVRERHVPAAAVPELLHPLDIGAERVAVLDADDGDLLAALRDPRDVGGGQRELDVVRGDLLRQTVDRVELRDRRLVRAVVSGRLKRVGHLRRIRLADVHDHERDVQAAGLHLRQIDLSGQVHRVVARTREVRQVDVVVRVERDDALVNGARACRQVLTL